METLGQDISFNLWTTQDISLDLQSLVCVFEGFLAYFLTPLIVRVNDSSKTFPHQGNFSLAFVAIQIVDLDQINVVLSRETILPEQDTSLAASYFKKKVADC